MAHCPDRAGPPVAVRTDEGYQYLLDSYLEPALGALPLGKLTPMAVRTWHAELVRDAPQSVAPKAYRLLHAILVTAADDGLIGTNPCRIKGASSEHTAERPMLGVADVATLAEVIEPHWKALVLLAAYGGLRFGELMGLRRRDVDLLHGVVAVGSQLVELSGDNRSEPTVPCSLRPAGGGSPCRPLSSGR